MLTYTHASCEVKPDQVEQKSYTHTRCQRMQPTNASMWSISLLLPPYQVSRSPLFLRQSTQFPPRPAAPRTPLRSTTHSRQYSPPAAQTLHTKY